MGMPTEKGSGIPYSIATAIPSKNKELKEKKNFRLSVAIAFLLYVVDIVYIRISLRFKLGIPVTRFWHYNNITIIS